jgi:hypothetical protein
MYNHDHQFGVRVEERRGKGSQHQIESRKSLERCKLHWQEGSSLDLLAAWSFDATGSQLVVHVARSGRPSMAFILAADFVEIKTSTSSLVQTNNRCPFCDH